MMKRLFRFSGLGGLSTRLVVLGALVIGAGLVACDESPHSELRFGTIEMTTTAPEAEKDQVTADLWVVKHTKFLVHVSAISVMGPPDDAVLAASATGQVVNHAKPGPKLLMSYPVRIARPWESVSFGIGPATAESAAVEGVDEPDLAMMTKDGLSVYIEASVARGPDTKILKWGFTSDTIYSDCEGDLNGALVKGIVVPPDGTDSADIVMRGLALLLNDKLDGTGQSRFDAIAAADADVNGEVTLDELTAVTLDTARLTGALYDVGATADIVDLGGYVKALTPLLVGSFRAKGKCTAAPAPAAAE